MADTRVQQLALGLTLLLLTPSALSGLALDDYVLLYQVADRAHNEWGGSAPFDLYRWFSPESTPRLMDGHGLPWWAHPLSNFALLRPVSSLTHVLDHALWPRSALAMHVHNLLWFALLFWSVARLYARAIDEGWARGVATVMFALDGAHGMAIGWISNRNALVTGVFGVLTLLCHDTSRQRAAHGRLGWAFAAWLCFGLCLFSGELGLGTAGYLFAYALFMEQGSFGHRARTLAPYCAIVVGWLVVRVAGNYGVYGLGSYVDPLREPWAFLRLSFSAVAVLLASQVAHLSADLSGMVSSSAQRWLVVAAFLHVAIAAWFVWPSLQQRSMLRVFALGAVMSVVPLTAAGLLSDRLLTLVGVGVFPVLAQAMAGALRDASERGSLRRGYARALAGAHLLLAPCLLPVLALAPAQLTRMIRPADQSFPSDEAVRGQAVMMTNVPDSLYTTYLDTILDWEGRTRPDKFYWFMASASSAQFERRSERELHLSCHDGCFDERWNERSSRLPLHVGDRVQLSEFAVVVTAVSHDGRPTECDLAFTKPLESSRYRWLSWQDGRLRPWQPPRIGERVRVEGS